MRRTSESSGSVVGAVRDFFFREEVPYGLAITRIALPPVLFADLLIRWPHARELYSADGATASIWLSYGWHSPFPEFSGAVVVGLFTLLLASLVTAALGWRTRASLAVATALYFYFTNLDAIGTLSKYTVIATHALLLLACSNCGAIWSLDALRRPVPCPRFPVWPARLMQILVGVVYLGAAMTKLHTTAFFSGDQMMFWMLTHINESHPLGEWMAYYPPLLVAGAYATVVWEILFLFLCWQGWGRRAVIALGVWFHTMTLFTLGLYFFPAMHYAIYFAFLNERDALVWGGRIERAAARFGVSLRRLGAGFAVALAPTRRLGPVSFVLTLWAVAVAAVAAERVIDPYGERGPDGPLALHEVDPRLVAKLLGPPEPMRPQDKVFAFELGTDLFGGSVVGRKTTFRPGETVTAQCVVPPPHEDMYVECNLHTADGRILERTPRVVLREMSRQNFTYTICDAVPPGGYELVLSVAGKEVARRRFDVAGDGPTPVRTAEAASPVLAN